MCHLLVGRGGPLPSFVIAGSGADRFLRSTLDRWPDIAQLEIDAAPSYPDLSVFDACALVAPITRGAGIKIKTLEAWAADLPVLGTAQAFSGVPASVWTLGGQRYESIAALATCCASKDEITSAIQNLRPSLAFSEYVRLTEASPTVTAQ